MTNFSRSFIVAGLATASALAQDDLKAAAADLARQVNEISIKAPTFDPASLEMARQSAEMARAKASVDIAGLRSSLAFQLPEKRLRYAGDSAYDSGTRALDERRYDEAVQRFNTVIEGKGTRADGALYWKAYALNRLGRKDEALAALAALKRDYPQSHWLNDAQALEVELKQGSGQAVSPAEETNEDLKLMAINSLMNADPDRAIPLLENLLKSSASPRVKDRAMFVLTQSRTPKAHQVLTDYAKGAGNPDLQIRAVRYIGMSGTPEAQQQLTSIYASSSDPALKREILRGLMSSHAKDAVFNVAKSEKDPELRMEAIRQLGAMKATDQLMQLYASETSADNKAQIIRALFAAGASDKLMDIAKSEKDEKAKSEAIRDLAASRTTSTDTLSQLYSAGGDVKTKREIVNGLHARGEAKLMVDLAKKESDPAMKRYIVERLANMHSKEATDYMMELLK